MKSIEEKLEYFEKTVITQAVQEKDTLEAAFENKMKAALSQAEAVYKRESKAVDRKAVEDTQKEARLIVSTAKNRGQTALAQKRNDIIDSVFGKLEEKLKDYVRSSEYEQFFERKLVQAMESGRYDGTVTVILSKEDAETRSGSVNSLAIRYLPGVSVKVEISTEDMIGGCKMRIPSSGRIIDNSIRAMMDAEREQFLSWSKLAIK
jgi:vacuolar-type H+-ATPase subunit E/Vma4